ncbi:MAG: hypothetical protein ACE5RC_03815 [Nitrosopumilus sp.]
MPLPAVGIMLFILGKLVEFNWISLSFDILSLLYDPLILSFLGLGSFLYIEHFYKGKITCSCHKGWKKKYHHLSSYVLGLVAAFTSYLIPVVALNLRIFDSVSDGSIQSQNVELVTLQIPFFLALTVFGFIARFISKDMFESIDGESGTLFSVKKSIFQQINESIIEIKNYVLKLKKN